MEQKNSLVAIIITLVIGLIVGFALGRGLGGVGGFGDTQKLQQQVEQAKKLFPPVATDVRSMSGTVKEVKEKQGVIVVETIAVNPFDDTPRVRTVTIASDTKIIRNEQKDPAAYQKEFIDFQKAVQAQASKPAGSAPAKPPMPFREVAATISDIMVGQQVFVTADQNIRDKTSFDAKTLIVSSSGPGGAGLPAGTALPPPPPSR